VVGEIRPLPLNTRETVVTDTPACCATSVMVIFLMLIVSANPFLGNPRRNDQGYTESVSSVKRFTACRIVAKNRAADL
jgi:hypothetical protein